MPQSRAEAIATWVRHQEALGALRVVLSALSAVGVIPLVVKGMVLAYELHDDVAERPMADIDLRVRPRDLLRAVKVLKSRGFTPEWKSRQLGAPSFLVERTVVELETSIGPPGLCALTVSRMLRRSRERLLPNGLRVREPDLHDHAVLLVVTAFKDKMFECPSWTLDDLARIARRIDPDIFLSRVQQSRLRTVTWIVADWMAEKHESAEWRMLRDRIAARPPRPAYSEAMRRHIAAHDYGSAPSRILSRLGSDSLPRRLWALAAGGAGTGVSWLASRL